jgi:hypothetical protein
MQSLFSLHKIERERKNRKNNSLDNLCEKKVGKLARIGRDYCLFRNREKSPVSIYTVYFETKNIDYDYPM